jgi:hypothetical protein
LPHSSRARRRGRRPVATRLDAVSNAARRCEQRGSTLSQRGSALSQRGSALSQRGSTLRATAGRRERSDKPRTPPPHLTAARGVGHACCVRARARLRTSVFAASSARAARSSAWRERRDSRRVELEMSRLLGGRACARDGRPIDGPRTRCSASSRRHCSTARTRRPIAFARRDAMPVTR